MKTSMPKWEKSLLNLLEKHMYLLAILFVSVLALYLRKVAVWWNHDQIISHFDYHTNHTETTLYYLLLRGFEYLPILPLHSMKWLGGLSDFCLAGLCVFTMEKKKSVTGCLCYLLCLFSPLVFLRGIIWALPDSTALCFLIGGYLLLQKECTLWEKSHHQFPSVYGLFSLLCVGIGLSLQPALLLLFVIFLILDKKEKHSIFSPCASFTICIIISCIILILCGLPLHESAWNSIYGSLRFATYHPLTGELFTTPGQWLEQMLLLYALPCSIVAFLHAFKNPTKANLTLALCSQFIGTILYSNYLFY